AVMPQSLHRIGLRPERARAGATGEVGFVARFVQLLSSSLVAVEVHVLATMLAPTIPDDAPGGTSLIVLAKALPFIAVGAWLHGRNPDDQVRRLFPLRLCLRPFHALRAGSPQRPALNGMT